jgi:hypothetical protein
MDVPKWLDSLNSYLVYKSLSILGQRSVNPNIPALKRGTLEMGPKTQNESFLKKIIIKFQYLWWSYLKIEMHMWYLQENSGTCTRGPT